MQTDRSKLDFDFLGIGHISITVPKLDEAITFYQNLFGAIPLQYANHFKNQGWAKNMGFAQNYTSVDVSTCFIVIPTVNLFITLTEFHTPKTSKDYSQEINSNIVNGIRHFSLKVSDLDLAFTHVKNTHGAKILNHAKDFKPSFLDPIAPADVHFVDKKLENNYLAKQHVTKTAAKVRFFLFSDPYGVVWEFESDAEETNYGQDGSY